MNIFNSLGSNYNLSFVFKSLFTIGTKQDKTALETFLNEKYGGKTILLYKGRQAIEIALKLLNLPKESSVAINGFTCFAVYQAITNAGLTADYIDIEKGDLNFSSDQLKKKIKENPNIKVVIIQNTLGYPADVKDLAAICKENNIILIEDLAHSVGGKFGDFVILSFSQDKLIDAISGGALIIRNKKYTKTDVITQKDSIKDRFYPLFTFIIRKTYSIGLGKIIQKILKIFDLLSKPMDNNTEPNTVAPWYCSLIKEAFDNLDNNLDHRKKIAAIYASNIDPKNLSSKITKNIPNSTNLRFPIFVENRINLINFLKRQNIFVSDIWYDAPIAPKKYMPQTNYTNQCPNAEKVSEIILNLPTHRNVSEQDAMKISQLINQWIQL
ncbi:MAG: aminotransferase class I/II-fold pyridoxal phosphate-dependent enzyme [Candidatus Daviesbacteria bacterium]|nr:aminotransferase class I/II-fold pyridoxal phosphate-dependent enzyme [Candidatus Daviesbacteria bacterium]